MSNQKTIEDLRKALFAALDGLTDKESPMEIERARAVSEVAQTIINSAKVEVEYMKKTGGSGSGFLERPEGEQAEPEVPAWVGGRTVHKLKG